MSSTTFLDRAGVRASASVLLLAALLLASPAARAESNDAAVAIGSTAAIGAFAGIVCWALQTEPWAPGGKGDAGGADAAEEAPDRPYARVGWFAGLQAIYAIGDYAEAEEASLQEALQPFDVTVEAGDHGWGVGGFVGNRCHSRFATEAEVQWMKGFTGDIVEESQGKVARFELEPVVVTVNFKGYLLTGRIQPYALVGIGTMSIQSTTEDLVGGAPDTSASHTMFAGRFGGGIDLYVTRHIVLKGGVDYVMPLSGTQEFDAIVVDGGVELRF